MSNAWWWGCFRVMLLLSVGVILRQAPWSLRWQSCWIRGLHTWRQASLSHIRRLCVFKVVRERQREDWNDQCLSKGWDRSRWREPGVNQVPGFTPEDKGQVVLPWGDSRSVLGKVSAQSLVFWGNSVHPNWTWHLLANKNVSSTLKLPPVIHSWHWGVWWSGTRWGCWYLSMGFPGSSAGKESTCNAGDPGSIPGSVSSPGEGTGCPLQCSSVSLVAQMVKTCLQCGGPGFNPWFGKILWRRAWQCTPVFLLGESPWTEEPGGLQSMGSQRVRHDWVTRHIHGRVNRIQSKPEHAWELKETLQVRNAFDACFSQLWKKIIVEEVWVITGTNSWIGICGPAWAGSGAMVGEEVGWSPSLNKSWFSP